MSAPSSEQLVAGPSAALDEAVIPPEGQSKMGLAPDIVGGRLAVLRSIAGGILLGLSYPPSPAPYLALVAFIPLLAAWRSAGSARSAIWRGLAFYFACVVVAFSWPLLHTIPTVAVASAAPLIGLPLILSLTLAGSWLIERRQGVGMGLIAFVTLHLAAEWIISHGPLAMPWPLVGNAMAEAEGVRMLASLSGVSGLTAWVLAINVAAYGAFVSRGRSRALASTTALLLVGGGWGGSHLLAARMDAAGGTPVGLTIGLIQPSVPPEVWADASDRSRVRLLVALTDSLYQAAPVAPALTIWPETSLPPCEGETICADVHRMLERITGPSSPPLLTGAIVAEADAAGIPFWRNAALVLSHGREPQRYDKIRLVPFAEGVPFADRFPPLSRLGLDAGGVAGYAPGTDRSPLRVGPHRVGVLVCFESLFPQDARAYARTGVDFLAVVSQDGWWGRSNGYRQHLAFTRLRAVESGVPVVFLSASGASSVIAADGSLHARLEYGVRDAIVAEVPAGRFRTLYTRLGDWVSMLALSGTVLFGMQALLRRIRGSDSG